MAVFSWKKKTKTIKGAKTDTAMLKILWSNAMGRSALFFCV